MRKKDILELKKRLKKDYCTFTKMCGCYVNGEKNVILKFRETFLNLEEDDYFKFLEIARKVLSGTIGNNILELNFPLNEDLINEKQVSLMQLKNSKLKDDSILDDFYNSIIDSYDYTGNFLILVFHDAYDVITKTKDNLKLMNLKKYMNMYFVQSVQFHFLNLVLDTMRMSIKLRHVLEIGLLPLQLMALSSLLSLIVVQTLTL